MFSPLLKSLIQMSGGSIHDSCGGVGPCGEVSAGVVHDPLVKRSTSLFRLQAQDRHLLLLPVPPSQGALLLLGLLLLLLQLLQSRQQQSSSSPQVLQSFLPRSSKNIITTRCQI